MDLDGVDLENFESAPLSNAVDSRASNSNRDSRRSDSSFDDFSAPYGGFAFTNASNGQSFVNDMNKMDPSRIKEAQNDMAKVVVRKEGAEIVKTGFVLLFVSIIFIVIVF